MARQVLDRLAAFSLILAVALAGSSLADDQLLVSVFDKPAPETKYDLRVVESTAHDLAQQLIRCTVGVEVGFAHGSGVIISEDGYVLTAAHVTGEPGRDVRIRLPDGRVAAGKTLGIHTVADGGLIKISTEGPWPFAPIVPPAQGPQVGDWCLALGHPGGFDAKRDPPLRLGRIIRLSDDVMQTDCPITGGDSGGPLFDMQGRVIGIHSRITYGVTENYHGPALAYRKGWEQMVAGEIYPTRPASRFLQALDTNGDGQLTREELPDGYQRRVFERLAEQFELDPEKPHSIAEFTDRVLAWRPSTNLNFARIDQPRQVLDESLEEELFVRGATVERLFREIVKDAGGSTVRIESDGDWVALGTIVDENGMVVTKASQLGSEIACRLPDQSRVAAKLVAVDADHDLALLQVDATGLDAVRWSTEDLKTGSWLAAPNSIGGVEGLGVMSARPREIAKTQAVLGVEIDTSFGSPKVARVSEKSGAANAGIQAGDVIRKIMGEGVKDLEELRKVLGEYRAGDVVQATIERGEDTLTVDVILGTREDAFFQFGTNSMNGPLSRRRDGFPSAVQYDAVVRPVYCGGPVVNIYGHVVGINIARANRIGSYFVPQDVLQPFLNKHTGELVASRVEE